MTVELGASVIVLVLGFGTVLAHAIRGTFWSRPFSRDPIIFTSLSILVMSLASIAPPPRAIGLLMYAVAILVGVIPLRYAIREARSSRAAARSAPR